jgi:hypothetical protein
MVALDLKYYIDTVKMIERSKIEFGSLFENYRAEMVTEAPWSLLGSLIFLDFLLIIGNVWFRVLSCFLLAVHYGFLFMKMRKHSAISGKAGIVLVLKGIFSEDKNYELALAEIRELGPYFLHFLVWSVILISGNWWEIIVALVCISSLYFEIFYPFLGALGANEEIVTNISNVT